MFGVSWRFRSSSISGASIQKTDGHYLKKRAALTKKAPPSSVEFPLKVETQSELHDARQVSRVYVQEVCAVESTRGDLVRHAAVDAVELRVVEKIEILPPEIHASFLGELEPLEEPEVKVRAARQIQGIAADVSKSKARGNRKGQRVVEERARYARVLIASETAKRTGNLVRTRPGA